MELLSLGVGPIIAFIVDLLKRIPFIKKEPKIAALVLAAITILPANLLQGNNELGSIVNMLYAWAVSVLTHETGLTYGRKGTA